MYASELAEYREDDISNAVRRLALRKRQEGETAFPDLGTIVDVIRDVRRDRQMEEESARFQAEREAEEEYRRLHPEEVAADRQRHEEFMAELTERIAKKKATRGW